MAKLITGDISKMVFGPVPPADRGKMSINKLMLSVLFALDGKKNTTQVARVLDLNIQTLRKILSELLELKLIQPIKRKRPVLGESFINYLVSQLNEAMGPIGQVVMEDTVADMGYGMNNIPSDQAAELISLLTHEVPNEEKRILFTQRMRDMLKQIGT